jgi:hypothetical protein
MALLALSCMLFSSCGSMSPEASNARLENRLDRRGERTDNKLDRMSIRGDARSSRWQKMADWEEQRYQQRWDDIMN